ncbi:hypothetical protein Trydic_g19941, partial [Trypoxylus dichotomus]
MREPAGQVNSGPFRTGGGSGGGGR